MSEVSKGLRIFTQYDLFSDMTIHNEYVTILQYLCSIAISNGYRKLKETLEETNLVKIEEAKYYEISVIIGFISAFLKKGSITEVTNVKFLFTLSSALEGFLSSFPFICRRINWNDRSKLILGIRFSLIRAVIRNNHFSNDQLIILIKKLIPVCSECKEFRKLQEILQFKPFEEKIKMNILSLNKKIKGSLDHLTYNIQRQKNKNEEFWKMWKDLSQKLKNVLEEIKLNFDFEKYICSEDFRKENTFFEKSLGLLQENRMNEENHLEFLKKISEIVQEAEIWGEQEEENELFNGTFQIESECNQNDTFQLWGDNSNNEIWQNLDEETEEQSATTEDGVEWNTDDGDDDDEALKLMMQEIEEKEIEENNSRMARMLGTDDNIDEENVLEFLSPVMNDELLDLDELLEIISK